jgi:Cu(I)/Ag(I) efflux system protein CusF
MKRVLGAAFAALLLAAPLSHADDPKAASAAQGRMTEGEVRKIDKEQGKLTVKHGEIRNLEMPAMTMVFRVKDKALLDKVKEGDKIKFSADKIDGNFTITAIDAGGHKH